MDKSVVVVVERQVRHGVYGKIQRRSSRFMAHDEGNAAKVGRQGRHRRVAAAERAQAVRGGADRREGAEIADCRAGSTRVARRPGDRW